MADLPTGTVTFLFTDIEGSTTRWEQHPEAMQAALLRHDAILRKAIEEHGGVVFKTVGDAFYAAFATAPQALDAALAAQHALHAEDWGDTEPLKVRMALHTGTADQRAGDYFGPPLNRVARLLSSGHGGQILLSQATQDLVHDYLRFGVQLRDLGEHRLKDLQQPERIFQVVAPTLPGAFPALKTLDLRPNNLPVQRSRLIGREQELAAVIALLCRADVGLVTLTGTGGTGKTRLALQVAAELLEDFAHGVFFVQLASVSDPLLVASTIVGALRIKEDLGQQPAESLRTYLRDKHLLLVLDNFEQVTTAAPLVADLVQVAPRLKVLVTSRAALHVYGEHEYSVPPLAVPDPQHLPALDALAQYGAVALFIERARAIKPDFAPTTTNAPAIAELCARLDGLPLAIELAAARTKLLTPQAMLPRLQHRLKLLIGGAQDLPTRQQTLRATIDWSYVLLHQGEQMLFRRLGVFVGGCTIEAAEAICNSVGDLPIDILDGLQALLDQSLLCRVGDAEGEPRVTMLESIREFARERLAEAGELEALQQRQAEYYLALVEMAEAALWGGPQQIAWLERLDREHENLRTVLRWSLEGKEPAQGLRLASALRRFWLLRGYSSEGRRWLELALTKNPSHPSPARAKALLATGDLAVYQGDLEAARAWLEESLVLHRELGDRPDTTLCMDLLASVLYNRGEVRQARALAEESLALARALQDQRCIASALRNVGLLARDHGDYAQATASFEESLRLSREVGDKVDIANSLNLLGTLALDQIDLAKAHALYTEYLSVVRELGDKAGIAHGLLNLGEMARLEGDYSRAAGFYEESLALNEELGRRRRSGAVLHNLGYVALHQGNADRAEALFKECLGINQEVGRLQGVAECLAGLAAVAVAQGQPVRAARLFGAAERLLQSLGVRLESVDQVEYDHATASGESQIDEAGWQAAWAEGRAMPLEQAIAYALSY